MEQRFQPKLPASRVGALTANPTASASLTFLSSPLVKMVNTCGMLDMVCLLRMHVAHANM